MMMLSTYVISFCRVAIGIIFLVAFTGKVSHINTFAHTVARFDMLPSRYIGAATLLFLSSEALIVMAMLIAGPLLPSGFALAIVLLTIFTLALRRALARSLQASCNCFGDTDKTISRYDVWRNYSFILLALLAWGISIQAPQNSTTLNILEWFVIVIPAIGLTTVWMHLEEIFQIFQQN